MPKEKLDNTLVHELADALVDYLEYTDHEVYSDLVRESIKRNVPNNDIGIKYLRIAVLNNNPEFVANKVIDKLYYSKLGYPMDRKKKPIKTKAKRKVCKCKK